jgi:hypothetical protein
MAYVYHHPQLGAAEVYAAEGIGSRISATWLGRDITPEGEVGKSRVTPRSYSRPIGGDRISPRAALLTRDIGPKGSYGPLRPYPAYSLGAIGRENELFAYRAPVRVEAAAAVTPGSPGEWWTRPITGNGEERNPEKKVVRNLSYPIGGGRPHGVKLHHSQPISGMCGLGTGERVVPETVSAVAPSQECREGESRIIAGEGSRRAGDCRSVGTAMMGQSRMDVFCCPVGAHPEEIVQHPVPEWCMHNTLFEMQCGSWRRILFGRQARPPVGHPRAPELIDYVMAVSPWAAATGGVLLARWRAPESIAWTVGGAAAGLIAGTIAPFVVFFVLYGLGSR